MSFCKLSYPYGKR